MATSPPDRDSAPSAETVIILVLSCRAHRKTRQRAVSETWARDVAPPYRLVFVEGGHSGPGRITAGRLLLPLPDDYDHLAEKTFRAIDFLLKGHAFTGLLKCDDDTYLHFPRFKELFDPSVAYAGNADDILPGEIPYAQGGAYWLGREACRQLVQTPFEDHSSARWFPGRAKMRKRGERRTRPDTSIEDLMVGDLLLQRGIRLAHDPRFSPDPFPSVHEDSRLFTCHHLRPGVMRRVHRQRRWLGHPLLRHLVPHIRHLPFSGKPR